MSAISRRAHLVIHKDAPTGNHLDLFLEADPHAPLVTYEAPEAQAEDFLTGKPVTFTLKQAHRRQYLDYTGAVSQGRGYVETLWKGTHRVVLDAPENRMELQLQSDEGVEVLITHTVK